MTEEEEKEIHHWSLEDEQLILIVYQCTCGCSTFDVYDLEKNIHRCCDCRTLYQINIKNIGDNNE